MMLRDHFGKCQATPPDIKETLNRLKSENIQSAADSKKYWIYSAKKIGLIDNTVEGGLDMTEESRIQAATMPPFGSDGIAPTAAATPLMSSPRLLYPEDEQNAPAFFYTLLQHIVPVQLTTTERVGSKKSSLYNLPGLGCRYCVIKGRLGLSRVFPSRRRALGGKIIDLYHHIRRCPLCPVESRNDLVRLYKRHEQLRKGQQQQEDQLSTPEALSSNTSQCTQTFAQYEREFLHMLWSRLGK